jgi:hypothetical protein
MSGWSHPVRVRVDETPGVGTGYEMTFQTADAGRTEAELAAWRDLHDKAAETRDGWHDRAERAEADLAAARQQLDQVRALHSKPTVIVGATALPIIYEKTRRILDAPARPAGHDESGQGTYALSARDAEHINRGVEMPGQLDYGDMPVDESGQ